MLVRRPSVATDRTAVVTGRPLRSIIRWAGSKRKLLPALSRYWRPSYDRYVEPFAGSCSLFFAIAPDRALLADKNADLMHALAVLRRTPGQLYDRVAALRADARTYARWRHRSPSALTSLGKAVRFVYLNRNCFNGIYRTNTDGEFNVPFSASRTGALPSRAEFVACGRLLRRATLRTGDFGATLRRCRKGDFVYVDPPYFVRRRRVFREYGPDAFGLEDFTRLLKHLDSLDARGVTFLLSYADTPSVRRLLKDREWRVDGLSVRRNIAGFKEKRVRVEEVLATNRPVT
jgi:DNA adenine methylase